MCENFKERVSSGIRDWASRVVSSAGNALQRAFQRAIQQTHQNLRACGAGVAHGCVDFAVDTYHGAQQATAYMGSSDLESHSLEERSQIMFSVARSNAEQAARIDEYVQGLLCVDRNNAVYQSSRQYTATGLTVASAAYGAYGLARAGVGVLRASQVGVGLQMATSNQVLNTGTNLNRFHQSAKGLSETGQNNIRILRGWAKSKGWAKESNPLGKPERWGIYEGDKFSWKLRIKPEPSSRLGLDPGSNIPRFDARLETGKQNYINPFSGQVGGAEIGTHLPLEFNYN